MLCIVHDIHDPYFNIASEEYLLKHCSDDVFMLYRNSPSIIVGKHQNAFAEINYQFTKEQNIPVIRRLSGGGTVFHDAGNLNFTFIQNSVEGKQIDFKRFTQPILEVLHELGVAAVHSGRNDLLIDGLKFSGNAEHVYKNRTLHHGTLLFSSELDLLRQALKVNPGDFEDKAVKSVRSHVTNVGGYLAIPVTLEEFRDKIADYVCNKFPEVKRYSFSGNDKQEINRLVIDKYQTWEWNYGYSPRFVVKKKREMTGCMFEFELEVDKGIIVGAGLKENGAVLSEAPEILIGLKYKEDIVREKLRFISRNHERWGNVIFNSLTGS